MASPISLGYFILFVSISIYVVSDSPPFDCRRQGQNCLDGDCNITSPNCTCTSSPQYMADCTLQEYDPSDINGAGCDGCGPNGICVSSVGCRCYPGYYGTNCTISYISVKCYLGGMRVFFNPYGTFSGLIYVKDKRNVTSCHTSEIPTLVPDNFDEDYEGHYIDLLNNDTDCGESVPYEDEDNIYTNRSFIINYNENILTGHDQLVHARCYYKKDDLSVSVGELVVDDDNSELDRDEVKNRFYPVTSAVTHTEDGTPVDLALPIAIETKLTVTLTLAEAYGDLEVNKILFNASTEGEDDYEWVIFDAGCPDEFASFISFIKPAYTDSTKNEITFQFSTFTALKHETISLWITTSICLEPGVCELSECTPGNSRKKRDAEPKETREFEIEFTIYDPTQGHNNEEGKPDSKACTGADCMKSKMDVLPIVFGVVGACLLLAIIALIACIAMRHSKHESKDKDLYY